MNKVALFVFGLCAAGLLLTAAPPAPVKLTGWFADEKCTASRVARGDLRPSNPECARKCVEEGGERVFISEQGKELLKVRDYKPFLDDLGYHLEVTGTVDPVAKTIAIQTVTRLGDAGASCARPRSAARK